MKLFTFIALIAISFSNFAVQLSCSNSESNGPEGRAAFRGQLDLNGGKIEFTGDGIFSIGSQREVITFFRNQRENEEKFSFAKYTGGGLFHLFFLSVPKKALEGNQQRFVAYLNFLREGVGGMAQFKVECKRSSTDPVMAKILKKFNNLVTYERLENEGFADVIESVATYESLPREVKRTLNSLKLSIFYGWDVQIQGTSEYVVNFSSDKYESDAIRIVKEGQTLGYVFNITECNEEECYGWDALYLDAEGFILKQSF